MLRPLRTRTPRPHQSLRLASLLLLVLAVLCAGPALSARTVHASAGAFYVGATSDSTAPVSDCTSPTNTDCTLRDAIAVATSGADTIQFNATGTGTITLGNGLGQGILN